MPQWIEALRTLLDPEPGLRLLTSVRPLGTMNHWLGERPAPVARVHPDDHAAGPAILEGPGGALAVEVAHDPTLARGTVVLPFGDRRCNPNAVVGTDALEPFSGQPVSNGTPVRLVR